MNVEESEKSVPIERFRRLTNHDACLRRQATMKAEHVLRMTVRVCRNNETPGNYLLKMKNLA